MKKFQIFVSSTYEDLKIERDQVIKAILEMGHIPVGMEMFSAADEQQWDIIKKQIDQSDYYTVIVAHRYGSMDGNISFTEKEYDYAVSKGVPVLGFIIDDSVKWPNKWIENNKDILKRLAAFKSKVSGRMVSFWKSHEDIYGKCGISLMKAFSTHPREGWVRSSGEKSIEMSEEIIRLSKENGELRARLKETVDISQKDHSNKINQIIDALRLNERNIYVWFDGAEDWGDPIKTNLLSIFEAVAPDLIDEASNKTLSDSLGLVFGTGKIRSYGWPVPTNYIKAYLADLVSLDLVSTSSKKHSVSDTKAYWMLTDFGQEVYGSIRKNELLKGLTAFEEVPEDNDEPEDETES